MLRRWLFAPFRRIRRFFTPTNGIIIHSNRVLICTTERSMQVESEHDLEIDRVFNLELTGKRVLVGTFRKE